MKSSSRRLAFFVAYITIAGSLWTASNWWETNLAEKLGAPLVSPNGGYRLETFKPFWVLPGPFHTQPDPHAEDPPRWFEMWGYPGFYRLYDQRTGALIEESRIYDLEFSGSGLYWGGQVSTVTAGVINLGPANPECVENQPAHPDSQE